MGAILFFGSLVCGLFSVGRRVGVCLFFCFLGAVVAESVLSLPRGPRDDHCVYARVLLIAPPVAS